MERLHFAKLASKAAGVLQKLFHSNVQHCANDRQIGRAL
jgi:hypothetical protein